ncbi:MAG: SLC13 family permease [Alphaproteobacteria bacterium]|nr:SLC13 family permease [Alphaproteobacteria bacterium]
MMEAFLFELHVLGLDLNGWLTLAVVLAATVLMAAERLGPDLVMFSALCVLVVAGVVEPREAMVGFADPATVTVGVLFVVARAVQDTGSLSQLAAWLYGNTKDATVALLRLVLPTAALSAFLNNTPIVAMLIPVATGFARRIGTSPGKLLMPLSFAAMLGGTCTLIGTSTNLVVSGLMERQGLAPLGMFELSWVGLPTAVVGILYLLTAGRALLVDRLDPLASAQAEAREYLAEVEVASDSPLIGRRVEAAGLRHLPGLFLVEIRRATGDLLRPVAPEDVLMAGDHLVFTGVAGTIKDLTAMPGLIPTGEIPDPGQELYEVVVSHNSGLVGRTVRGAQFRRRFDAAILAVHRAGERIEGRIGDIVLRAGDTLMLSASPGFRRAWQQGDDFYLVSELAYDGQPRYQKAPIALMSLALMVFLPAFTGTSMTVSSMAALVILLATQCVSPRSARDAVNWPVLVLIGAAFGISRALVDSGAAQGIADVLITATQPFGPYALLAGVYLLTMVFSLFISNAAAAALLFPVALTAAVSSGLDPRPFAIALTMAASAAFATPVGYQTNLLVYGPGGYRYLDFVRVGAPLNALCFAVTMVVVPLVWPL